MPPAPVASGCSAQPRATSRHLEVGASRPASDQLCRVTQLLRAPLPASAVAVGCVSLGAGLLSQVEAKRAEPLPQKTTKRINYEHDRKSHPNRTQPGASTAGEPTRQTFKVSSPATGAENRIFA